MREAVRAAAAEITDDQRVEVVTTPFWAALFVMSRLLAGLVILAAVIGMAVPVSAQTIGVVLMHGNTDSPDGTSAPLAAALEGAGYLVERPEMCWSYRRRRDRPLLDCLAELEAPIGRLTGRGARTIVVAGMSVGGLAALAFGARRSGLAGIIALAPNGSPERLVGFFPQIAGSVAQAWAMVAVSRGDERGQLHRHEYPRVIRDQYNGSDLPELF
jgi:hypothetical protein